MKKIFLTSCIAISLVSCINKSNNADTYELPTGFNASTYTANSTNTNMSYTFSGNTVTFKYLNGWVALNDVPAVGMTGTDKTCANASGCRYSVYTINGNTNVLFGADLSASQGDVKTNDNNKDALTQAYAIPASEKSYWS